MNRLSAAIAWALCAAPCSAPPPPLPSLPSPAVLYAEDDRFVFTPALACSNDAARAFAAADPAAIDAAAASGVPFDCHVAHGQTLLSAAVVAADLARVTRLLSAGADPNGRWGPRGDRLPLQEAIECRNYGSCDLRLPIVQALLAHGADPDLRWCPFESRLSVGRRFPGCLSSGGWTPLIAAAAYDAPAVVVALLDAGADPWSTTYDGFMALDMASLVATFQFLEAAMFPNPTTRAGESRRVWRERRWPRWLHNPALQTRLTAVLGAGPMAYAPPPPPPLPVTALPTGRRSLAGVDFERPSPSGRGAILRHLMVQGEDPNARLTGRSDWTALALAVSGDHHEAAVALLEGGADPNARMCGPAPGQWQIADNRTEEGCSLARGTTPLMMAAASPAVDTMRVLIAHGADIQARDWRGRSVADYAPPDVRDMIMRAAQDPAWTPGVRR